MATGAPTLLIVEDARDQALLVELAARRCRAGLEVRVVHDGASGTAYLSGATPFQDRRIHPRPDLVILDLFMPEMDGFAVLEWIRDRAGLSEIPVVVLTSSGNPDDEVRALRLGASRVYRKPALLSELGDVVREIVETYIPRTSMLSAHLDRLA